MGKRKKIPKIPKRFKKILTGRQRGKGEGLTRSVGLTKGQGLASLPPGLTLESIVKKIPKGKKLKKTIFKTAQKGTKESDMKKKKYRGGYHNQRSNNNNNKTDAMSVQKDAVEKKLKEEPRTIKQAKDAGKDYFINKAGKRLAAVTKEELKASNMSLRDYLNKQKGLTRKDGKKVTKTTKKDDKLKKGTTDIFKVKKGESTTRAADAKKKQQEAQKKLGRSFVAPGKATRRKLSPKEKKNQMLARQSFRSAQAIKVPEGETTSPGREKAMARARKIQQRNLPKKKKVNQTKKTNMPPYNTIGYFNKGGRIKFKKAGDGDMFVRRAYGGKVGK